MSYIHNGVSFEVNTSHGQMVLSAAYRAAQRPLCLCSGPPGIPVYVATNGPSYHLRRMPASAASHTMECDHFEPPCDVTGLGAVNGTAIMTEDAGESYKLALGFSLGKSQGRALPPHSDDAGSAQTVEAKPKKLSIRALLDHLWHSARLTHWSPAMTGRRNWPVVKHALSQAATSSEVRGSPLLDRLFIPEPWNLAAKTAIAARCGATIRMRASVNQDESCRRCRSFSRATPSLRSDSDGNSHPD